MFIFKDLIVLFWNFIFKRVYKVTLTNFWVSHLLYTLVLYGAAWALFFILLYFVFHANLLNLNSFVYYEYLSAFGSSKHVYALHGPVMVYGIFSTNTAIFHYLTDLLYLFQLPQHHYTDFIRFWFCDAPVGGIDDTRRHIYWDFNEGQDSYIFTAISYLVYSFETDLLSYLIDIFFNFVNFYGYCYIVLVLLCLFCHCCFATNHILKDYLRNLHVGLYVYYFYLLVYVMFRLFMYFLTSYVIISSFSYAFFVIFCLLFMNIIILNISKFNTLLSYFSAAIVSIFMFVNLNYFIIYLQQFYYVFMWTIHWIYILDRIFVHIQHGLFYYVNDVNGALIYYVIDHAFVLLATHLEWLLLEAFINIYLNIYS